MRRLRHTDASRGVSCRPTNHPELWVMAMKAITREMHHLYRPSIYQTDLLTFDWNACQREIWCFVKGRGSMLAPELQNVIIKHTHKDPLYFIHWRVCYAFLKLVPSVNISCLPPVHNYNASPVYKELQYTNNHFPLQSSFNLFPHTISTEEVRSVSPAHLQIASVREFDVLYPNKSHKHVSLANRSSWQFGLWRGAGRDSPGSFYKSQVFEVVCVAGLATQM